uniref:protein-serine/threonine phosphatase n=1 Tax=Zea mays TaxID=4577 RepID=A0A804NM37_MAIZE
MYSDTSAKLGSRVSRLGGFGSGPLTVDGSLETRKGSAEIQGLESGCTALSTVKQGDLMVVANVNDSRVVLGTTSDDDAITPSSSSSI